ncbi:MAG: hypothetical protein AABY13_04615 [Nanoarchaeota archaeon]
MASDTPEAKALEACLSYELRVAPAYEGCHPSIILLQLKNAALCKPIGDAIRGMGSVNLSDDPQKKQFVGNVIAPYEGLCAVVVRYGDKDTGAFGERFLTRFYDKIGRIDVQNIGVATQEDDQDTVDTLVQRAKESMKTPGV